MKILVRYEKRNLEKIIPIERKFSREKEYMLKSMEDILSL